MENQLSTRSSDGYTVDTGTEGEAMVARVSRGDDEIVHLATEECHAEDWRLALSRRALRLARGRRHGQETLYTT